MSLHLAHIKEFHKLAIEEKENYLSFIYKLGKNKFQELFKFPHQNFSFWWFSLISEKAVTKSDSFKNLISFLISDGAQQKRTAHFEIKKTFIYQFLKGIASFFGFILRSVYIKIVMKNFSKRKAEIFNWEYLIVSYFPLINKTLARQNIFENSYVPMLHQILERRYPDRYAHILMQCYLDGYGLQDSVKMANEFAKKQNIFFIEEFLRFRHLFYILIYYIYFIFLFMFNLFDVKKSMAYEYKGKIYNVWNIFKCDFYSSFCGNNLVSSLFYVFLFREMVGLLKKRNQIFTICENQPWEKALYIAAKDKGHITIGVQHTVVPELFLQYFNVSDEVGAGNFIEKCPLPDYMATVGEMPAALLTKYGWPVQRTIVSGAQRFYHIKKIREKAFAWKAKKDYFVCIFSIYSELPCILSMVQKAFDQSIKYKIVLKPHPSMKYAKIMEKFKRNFNHAIFEYNDGDLGEIMLYAKGIIAASGAGSLYALACDIPVIIPRFSDNLDCNPLSYISGVPVYVDSPAELRVACDRIMGEDKCPIDQKKYDRLLNSYLHFPESEDKFFEKITSLRAPALI